MDTIIRTDSVQATQALAALIASSLHGGEVIELRSDIGGGKTAFTKGLAHGMGISDTVQSPTFTISRIYIAPSGLELHHYDFYRLKDAGILSAELAESLARSTVVTVIEWADVVESVLPPEHITITIKSLSDMDREFVIKIPKTLQDMLDKIENFNTESVK